MIKNNVNLFIYGTVVSSQSLKILPKYIGSSKEAYLQKASKNVKSSLFFFFLFGTFTAVAYALKPKDRVIDLQREESPQGLECSICMNKKKRALLFPCYHLSMCENCLKSVTNCPICREKIEFFYRINY